MKEYLTKNRSGNYQLVNHRFSDDDIEVPEGAEAYLVNSKVKEFLKNINGGMQRFHNGSWINCLDSHINYIDHDFNEVLWIRGEKESIIDKLVDSLPEFKHDFVNHPKHYCYHPSGIECIEITRHHDFAIGNAIKYLWRAGLKDSNNEIQDLKKAVWYIQDKISQLENK